MKPMQEPLARGLVLDTGIKRDFADGSVMDTAGIAYNIKWLFGRGENFSTPHDLNFHFLTSAPANVLLSDTFLSGTKSFSEHDSYLMDRYDDYEDEDMRNFLLAIDFDKKKNRTPGMILTVLRYRVFP